MSRQSPRQCPISANAIASQLVKSGKYEDKNQEIVRSIMQELSDLWIVTTSDIVNVFGDFS